MSSKKYFPGAFINGVFFLLESGRKNNHRRGIFICPLCKEQYEADVYNVVSLKSKSCGCENRNYVTHDMSKTPEYRNWSKMKERCYDPNSNRHELYAGNGVMVCDRWKKSFENFFADMGKRPSPVHSLDRYPDKNGNYEPGNVRWATPKEQGRNKRNNRMVVYQGESKPLSEWCEIFGFSSHQIQNRINRYGWTLEEAFSTPIGVTRKNTA